MGRRGVCWDNAAAESFFSAFKLETLYGLETRRFTGAAQARGEIFRWIAWYDNRRRHSRAGYASPADYESRYWEASTAAGAPEPSDRQICTRAETADLPVAVRGT